MHDYNKLALKAVSLQKQNKSHEAKKIYIDLLKIDRNPQILRLLGLIEFDEKNYEQSLKQYKILENEGKIYKNSIVDLRLPKKIIISYKSSEHEYSN